MPLRTSVKNHVNYIENCLFSGIKKWLIFTSLNVNYALKVDANNSYKHYLYTASVGVTTNEEKPVVVMVTSGECSVSVVRAVVQGIHPLGRGAADRPGQEGEHND